MTLGPRKSVVLVAAVVVAAALGLVLWFAGAQAGIWVLGVIQIVTVVAVAAAHVQLRRDVRRSQARQADAARDVLAAVQDSTASLRTHVDDRHDVTLRRIVETPPEPLDADRFARRLARDVAREVEGLRQSLHRVEARLGRRRVADFAQVEALLGLYAEVHPRRALPATRGWAASPDLLLLCWTLARDTAPRTIVECGSGVSTVLLAYACERNGAGQVIALDHDPDFAARTRTLLADHGLEDWAEVRDAPLEPLPGDGRSWYRSDAVPEGPIDLLLVDGPPTGDDESAREPALDVLYERLGAAAVVVVDDHVRDGERAMVDRWLDRHPDLRAERLRHEKGTVLLRRGPGHGG